MNALAKRLIALGLSSTLAISGAYLVAPWEGSKKDKQGNNIAYIDMVGVPTICSGFTPGVKLGDKKTDAECEQLLAKELSKYNTQMKKNVRISLSPYEEIAYTSFVWNVGVGAWNNSTLLEKLNANDRVGACNEILKWNKGTFSRQAAYSNPRMVKFAHQNLTEHSLAQLKDSQTDVRWNTKYAWVIALKLTMPYALF